MKSGCDLPPCLELTLLKEFEAGASPSAGRDKEDTKRAVGDRTVYGSNRSEVRR